MRITRTLCITFGLLFAAAAGNAATLTEDFEAPFPAWESGWLGQNSNLQNYYYAGGQPNSYRGNNPDGLWLSDGTNSGPALILFDLAFAQSLTSLSFDVAGYAQVNLRFFNALGVTLSDQPITLTNGAFTDPGSYVNYGVMSNTGIGGFEFYGGSVEGNTSVDNFVANTGALTATPEPGTYSMFLAGAGALALAARRRSKRTA